MYNASALTECNIDLQQSIIFVHLSLLWRTFCHRAARCRWRVVHSGFLPLSKCIHLRFIGDSKGVSVHGCFFSAWPCDGLATSPGWCSPDLQVALNLKLVLYADKTELTWLIAHEMNPKLFLFCKKNVMNLHWTEAAFLSWIMVKFYKSYVLHSFSCISQACWCCS